MKAFLSAFSEKMHFFYSQMFKINYDVRTIENDVCCVVGKICFGSNFCKIYFCLRKMALSFYLIYAKISQHHVIAHCIINCKVQNQSSFYQ